MNVTMTLPTDKLAFIIEKSREFDMLVDLDDPMPGSNPADDRELMILQDTPDNPVRDELAGALGSLNDDQLTELLALLWVGRGDYGFETWNEAVRQARFAKNRRVVRYLIGTPMLGDLIEEGLAELGVYVPLPTEDSVE